MSDRASEAVLTVRAGDLQRVLEAVVSGEVRKSVKVSLTLAFHREAGTGELEVADAIHGARSDRLPTRGEWPESCQLAGVVLRKMTGTYPPEADLDLIQTATDLIIRRGG